MKVRRRFTTMRMRGKPLVLRLIEGCPRGWKRTDFGECRRVSGGDRYHVDVRMDQEELRFLDATIHELTHAGLWDLDEEVVEEFAADLAGILYKLGWRYTHGRPDDRAGGQRS